MVNDDSEHSTDPLTTYAEAYEDAPASVLTPTQREYFFGDGEPSESGKRALLRRIRQRITAGLWDFSLLVRTLPDEEIRKISDENPSGPQDSAIGFFYAAQPRTGVINEDLIKGGNPTGIDRRARWMETKMERGIAYAISVREGVEADVDVSINVDRKQNLEELAEGDLADLSRDQLDTMLVAGIISRHEYAEANARRLGVSHNK